MYLKMKNSSNTTQTTAYALYDSAPKPYLKVNKSKVLPLTTSTTTGLQLKAKLGTKTYRPLQKVTYNSISSSTTTSTSSRRDGLTVTSANTSSYTSSETTSYIEAFKTITTVTTNQTWLSAGIEKSTRYSSFKSVCWYSKMAIRLTTGTLSIKYINKVIGVTSNSSSITFAFETNDTCPNSPYNIESTVSKTMATSAARNLYDLYTRVRDTITLATGPAPRKYHVYTYGGVAFTADYTDSMLEHSPETATCNAYTYVRQWTTHVGAYGGDASSSQKTTTSHWQ